MGESFLISGNLVSLIIHIAGSKSIQNFVVLYVLITLMIYKGFLTVW
jgi:hypothetical protein